MLSIAMARAPFSIGVEKKSANQSLALIVCNIDRAHEAAHTRIQLANPPPASKKKLRLWIDELLAATRA